MRFEPASLDFIANPYPAYAELRADAPVWYDEVTDHWLVSRYADVNALLRDRRFGRTYLHAATHEEMGRPPDAAILDPFWHLIRSGILDMEPPDHTRVRALVSKAFTPRFVEGLRPRVERITRALVDDAAEAGEFDLLSSIAEPLPVTVIAEMLGVPETDHRLLRPWSADICKMYELNPSEEAARDAVRASVEFSDYLRDLSRERRAHPGEDLISGLAHAVDEGERLTEDELIGTCVLLLNAGHEATVNVTVNGWWALFRNPDQLESLRRDPSMVVTAVEELMRYDTPLQMFERWVLEPVKLHGVEIPQGAELGLLFGSANHDPSLFRDPDRMDLARDPNPHLAFGAGVHFCLGAPLARIELQTSFTALLDRFPRLQPVEEPRWKPNYIIRGLESLKVAA
ncbi:MAG TPA: cytochrome P450 [Actinomycetota bacterium]|jgi:cytochrome P450|nr:cytochrome P450 [Actinomycetota bacterium]